MCSLARFDRKCRIFFTGIVFLSYLCMQNSFDYMLVKFKVSNFKNFGEDVVFDLSSSKGYAFNSECIKNSVVNCAIIYGYNGVGKSNLGFAIFDIIEHLTDKNREEWYYKHYINANSDSKTADFSYEFLIEGMPVKYEYSKTDYKTLVSEKLWIGDAVVVDFDRNKSNRFESKLKGTETLNKAIKDEQLSVLKYIKNNSVLEDNPENRAFKKFFDFVERMIFFRSLEDRFYLGLDTKTSNLTNEIIERGKVREFEDFLNAAHVECKLSVVELLGKKELAFDFGEKKILLHEIISTGTSSLLLFYFWYLQILSLDISFVFIDEFDAFYHHELSKMVVQMLKKSGIQFVLTTHNISIMSNDLMRPDCYFLMGRKSIRSLSQCTDREIREAHNIEKIYKAGGFDAE